MEDSKELTNLQQALSRWREGCLFYFKLDLAIFAAIAAVASYLKVEDSDLLLAAHEYKTSLLMLVALVVYALFFELYITHTSNRRDLPVRVQNEKWVQVAYAWLMWGYRVQVIGHVMFVVHAAAFFHGYSDSFAEHAQQIGGGT